MKFDLYDFDGTIYDGDSGIDFILFCIKKRPKLIFNIPSIIYNILYCYSGHSTKKEMKEKIFSFLNKEKDIDSLVIEFWKTHEYKIKDFWKNSNHDADIVISASCTFWLKYIKDKYKIYDLIATDMNKHTGKIKGENCLGEAKVDKFIKKYESAKIMKMYTDSEHDLPLIELAKEGYMVKKNKIYNYYDYKPSFVSKIIKIFKKMYASKRETINYLIIGGITTFVSLSVKWLLLFLILNIKNPTHLQISIIVSWIVAVIFAYFTNRAFVFGSKNKNILKEASTFISSRIVTLLLDMFLSWMIITVFSFDSKLEVFIITIIIQVLVTVLNYVLSKLLVFNNSTIKG